MGPMKRAFGGLFAVAAVTLSAAPAEAASCRMPSGRVVATGEVAKLIAVPTPSGAALFACIRRSGRKVALDDSYSDARIAGRWVAWQRPGSLGKWRIAVRDLRTGKERLVIGRVAAHSLKLTTRGSIAWAQALDDSAATPLYANEVGRGGRLLDGGDVDVKSIDLAGRLLTWLSGGKPESVFLR